MSELVGHRYSNPEMDDFENFNVVRMMAGQEATMPLATSVLSLIREALLEQFRDMPAVQRQVMQTMSINLETVSQQHKKLKQDSGEAGRPLYVEAIVSRLDSRSDDFQALDEGWSPVGIGKAKYADGRPRSQRLRHPSPSQAANLADVGDIYVLPRVAGLRNKQQGQGFGTAILRSMLDHYPENMPAVVYEYPAINPRITPLLQELGFKAIQERSGDFCGFETPQMLYAGPFCGDLIEMLEKHSPWLRKREALYLAS